MLVFGIMLREPDGVRVRGLRSWSPGRGEGQDDKQAGNRGTQENHVRIVPMRTSSASENFACPHPGGSTVHPRVSRSLLRLDAGIPAEAFKPFRQLFARRGTAVNQKPIAEPLSLSGRERPVAEG